MFASAPAKPCFVRADVPFTVNPCKQTWPGNGPMADQDELILEIFQETPVESGLLDSVVLSVVLLRSGNALGDEVADDPLYSLMTASWPGKVGIF